VKRIALAGLLALLAGGPAAAAPGDLEEVLACVRKNAPHTALVQTVELISVDRAGRESARSAKLSAKRAADGLGRLLLRVEEPADLRGTAFLWIQKPKGSEIFVYLPEMKKVRRVSSKQLQGKLLGSDFSYEEVSRIYADGDGEAKRLPDAEKDGRPIFVVEATPGADSGSAYVRVASFVDRETCVPLEIAFFEAGAATPRKVLSVDPARVTKEGEVHVPRLVRMRDLVKGTESRLVTHAVEVDPALPDELFTRSKLEFGR
jgi:hypothetical protein